MTETNKAQRTQDVNGLLELRDGKIGAARASLNAYTGVGRVIPNLVILAMSVVRFIPNLAAAPPAPPITHPTASSVRKISARSESLSVVSAGEPVRQGQKPRPGPGPRRDAQGIDAPVARGRPRRERGMTMIYPREDSKYLWSKVGDKRKSMKTENWREAEKREALWIAKMHREEISGIRETPKYTCTDAINKVQARWAIEGKMSVANLSSIRQTRKSFGNKSCDEVTTELLERFVIAKQREGYQPATSNRRIQLLRRGFHLLGTPWPRFELPSEAGNVREGFFTSEHLAKLLAALPTDLRDFTEFCAATGLRKGTARQITWGMVDKTEIRIPAEIVKNRKPQTIPLAGAVREIIERRKAKRTVISGCLFTWDGEPILEFRDTWAKACIKAGCAGMLFHDLRRTAVRNLIAAGVSQAVAMSVSGHRTVSVFLRYQITTTEDQARALERVQQHRAS